MYKKILVSFFLFTSLTIYAANEFEPEDEPAPSRIENPGKDMLKEGVLPSARKCIGRTCECRKGGIITNLDFIYFQTKDKIIKYGILNIYTT